MKRTSILLVAVATVAGVLAFKFPASGRADEKAGPTSVIQIPPGYRDWRLISVAHEAGNLTLLVKDHPQRRTASSIAQMQVQSLDEY